jgi:hypothetical protein
MMTAMAAGLFGWYVIYSNKTLLGKEHATSWHGQMGVATMVLWIFLAGGGAVLLDPVFGIMKGSTLYRRIHKYTGESYTVRLSFCLSACLSACLSVWDQVVRCVIHLADDHTHAVQRPTVYKSFSPPPHCPPQPQILGLAPPLPVPPTYLPAHPYTPPHPHTAAHVHNRQGRDRTGHGHEHSRVVESWVQQVVFRYPPLRIAHRSRALLYRLLRWRQVI